MVVFPNAKINLGLYITEKRTDSYHNLISCFYPVKWEDALEIIPSDSFSFSQSGLAISNDPESNLVIKAYRMLAQEYTLPPCAVHLHKNIPMGAGLGGGSADAAFTLNSLNTLFQLDLSREKLIRLSEQLGSDCPFFIDNVPCIASSKGEVLSPSPVSLKGYSILLVYPGIHISTQEAYAGVKPRPFNDSLEEILKEPPSSWKNVLVNQFEEHLFKNYPELKQLKQSLYDMGAEYASMSGSGSTVYGIFKTRPPVPKIGKWLMVNG